MRAAPTVYRVLSLRRDPPIRALPRRLGAGAARGGARRLGARRLGARPRRISVPPKGIGRFCTIRCRTAQMRPPIRPQSGGPLEPALLIFTPGDAGQAVLCSSHRTGPFPRVAQREWAGHNTQKTAPACRRSTARCFASPRVKMRTGSTLPRPAPPPPLPKEGPATRPLGHSGHSGISEGRASRPGSPGHSISRARVPPSRA
jgi:hypothetical protein